MTTTAEYRYTLPGDELRVQAAAYAWGMCALIQIASHFHLGELSDAYITIPRDRSDIEGFAQELATKTVNSPERNTEAPITNSPELYIEECVIGFTEGYLFGLFAMYRNLMDLLSPPETFHIALAFALELKLKESAVPEPEDEYDERILNGVERLKLIYKQYRRLN